MKIGVPKEIKNNEFRVALTPTSVQVLVDQSHEVYIQASAGNGIGFTDEDYINSGACHLKYSKRSF
jgi:alanine dehydrogenase